MNPLAIPMLSRKKLNTYGVESPCECLPGVGSFLANPGLSKEQLVPSCEIHPLEYRHNTNGVASLQHTKLRNSSIGILAQYLQRCTMRAFILRSSSIGIPAQRLRLYLLATLSISAVFIWKTWTSLLMYGLLSRNSLYQLIFTLGRLHINHSLLNKK